MESIEVPLGSVLSYSNFSQEYQHTRTSLRDSSGTKKNPTTKFKKVVKILFKTFFFFHPLSHHYYEIDLFAFKITFILFSI